MYPDNMTERKTHPKETASISSLLTFKYIYPYIKRGNIEDLKEDDICKNWSKFLSRKIGDKMERLWKQQEVVPGKTRSVIKLLCDCFLKKYLLLGVLQLAVKLFYITLTPYSVSRLVNYFKDNQDNITKQEAWLYAGMVIFTNSVFLFYEQHYMLLKSELGIEIVTSLSSLVYRKTLKLSSSKISEITTGKIVTAITKDIVQMEQVVDVANDLWVEFIQAAVVLYLLYIKLGMSGLTGLTLIITIVIFQLYISTSIVKKRQEANNKSDERVELTKETITSIKILKMYALEDFFIGKIIRARKLEIQQLRILSIWRWFNSFLGNLSNKLSFFFVIICYIWFGHTLSAEIVYYVATCFQKLRRTLAYIIPACIGISAEFISCVRRLELILHADEIEHNPHFSPNSISTPIIQFNSADTASADIKILKNLNMKLESGLNILTGPVGSGKSSLFKAILGEHETVAGKKNVIGSISYCPQNPWVFPSSIKQNILFGQTYDEAKYKQILKICDLSFDIDILTDGDETILNDCGVNLSKGQQTRVNMARALYKDSDIYIFDDSLSSLDSHVRNYVFHQAIEIYLKNKLVILSTHDSLLAKKADHLIKVSNGTFTSSGRPKDVSFEHAQNNDYSTFINETDENHYQADEADEEPNSEVSKLIPQEIECTKANIYQETIRSGRIGFEDYKKYFSFSGGFSRFFIIVGFFISIEICSGYSEKLLSNWISVEEAVAAAKSRMSNNITSVLCTSSTCQFQEKQITDENSTEVSYNTRWNKTSSTSDSTIEKFNDYVIERNIYINIYSILIVSYCLLIFVSTSLLYIFSLKISKNLHKSMITNILRAKMYFFDINMRGNILNRFSKDIFIVDELVPFVMNEALRMLTMMTATIVLIATINWSFIVITLILLSIFYLVCSYCIRPIRTLQRISMATRSPVLGHLNATLEGLDSIRAFRTQAIFMDEFDKHQDLMVASNHLFEISMRGLAFFLHMLSAVYTAVIILRFLIVEEDSSSNVGLAITQSFVLSSFLDWGLRQWILLESMMTNFQRASEYTDIEKERQTGQIIENWPSKGCIVFKNVSLKYRANNETVLKNLNFEIEQRERIAIVGRTGSGKSSIAAAIFRLYEFVGDILIDNINIENISTNLLRVSIGLIPQDLFFFSGSVRENLDPLNNYSDSQIWKALHDVNLGSLIEKLEDNIYKTASNFSVGQKQLFCIAKAILRKVRIVVLDEVTAFVDEETALMIHNKILEVFDNCTIITITHNLHSVLNYNKILVVHKGIVIEFDKPSVLLDNKGAFYRMLHQVES
ncbi:hypothetical protein WA026_008107 [Henosepilachna vigintioctopunctata]|uniref:Multidrug resistance-associated protein lethal(2)03659 n=1 Tax=Henosepilachna vigintioctopunctata TaxID=420089 RepID=A0AAW1TRX5_9CUCU